MQEISLWSIATIVGPIVLLILFAYVIIKNRSTKVPRDVIERATKANYAAEDRISKEKGREHDAKVQEHKDDFQAHKDKIRAHRDDDRTERDETL